MPINFIGERKNEINCSSSARRRVAFEKGI